MVIHDGPEHFPDALLTRNQRLGDELEVLVGFEVDHGVELEVGPRRVVDHARVDQTVVQNFVVCHCFSWLLQRVVVVVAGGVELRLGLLLGPLLVSFTCVLVVIVLLGIGSLVFTPADVVLLLHGEGFPRPHPQIVQSLFPRVICELRRLVRLTRRKWIINKLALSKLGTVIEHLLLESLSLVYFDDNRLIAFLMLGREGFLVRVSYIARIRHFLPLRRGLNFVARLLC